MDIGDKIKRIRNAKGYTLTDLQNKTGLSCSYLSDVENSKCSASLKALNKIAIGLNVGVEELVSSGEKK